MPEPAQEKGWNCIVRSMAGGKQGHPFLVVGSKQISSAAHGTTPLIHLYSSWCNSQEWLKQLLSLALLRLNLLSFGQGELNACDLQPDVLQYRSAELGFLMYSGCEM